MKEILSDGRHEYERTPEFTEHTSEELENLYSNAERGNVSVFLYHGVPWNMQGETLYPLNQLRDIYPEIYTEHAAKYDWRKEVMEEKIPLLDCLWNDVIFLTAVNPKRIRHELEKAGMETFPANWHCWQIDPEMLEPQNTVVSLAPHEPLSEQNVVRYDPKHIASYGIIPLETLRYYRKAVSEGKAPLMYHRIPHILYKGTIDVSGLKTFRVE